MFDVGSSNNKLRKFKSARDCTFDYYAQAHSNARRQLHNGVLKAVSSEETNTRDCAVWLVLI
jgi:hypothetical protein